MAHLQVRILTDRESLANIVPSWDKLFRRSPDATPFQRPEWLLSWMRAFEPQNPIVIAVEHRDQLVGLAPFLIYTRQSERILAFMGGGVSDYLDVLVEPDFAEQAACLILEVSDTRRSQWTRLELTDLPEASVFLRPAMSENFRIAKHDCCVVLDLCSGKNFSELVPAHKVRNYRNAWRRIQALEKTGPEITPSNEFESRLGQFFHLYNQRWASPGHIPVDARVQKFHFWFGADLCKKQVLRLYEIRLAKKMVASVYALWERGVVYCYLQTFDPEYTKLSPGTALLGAVIEDAIRAGAKRMDFLRGQEAYKLAWGGRVVSTYRAVRPHWA